MTYLHPDGDGRLTVDLGAPGRALAIGAHPDDIDFGCGGTLAKWAAAGCEITELILTDGSKGSWDPKADRDSLVALRREEQRAAAASLGASDVVFLDHVDGELASGLAERAEVCRVIREVQPDVVLGHDPWKRYRLHPDHRHAGLLAVEGIVAARDPHFFPEQGLPPHRPRGPPPLGSRRGGSRRVHRGVRLRQARRAPGAPEPVGEHHGHRRRAERRRCRLSRTVSGSGPPTPVRLAGLPMAEAFKRIDRL